MNESLNTAADRMKNMNPDTMRAQAQALRSMDPNMVRASNPQMRNFTDQQIKDAATQMEQMANNPFMMQQAAEEMKKMSPQQMEEMQKMMGGGQVPGVASSPQRVDLGMPIGTRVIVEGLKGAAQYNGMSGVVRGSLQASNGRQNIFVESADKEMLLKPANFNPEPRELSSLSLKEMQAVLISKGVSAAKLNGADKSELLEMIKNHVDEKEDNISLLIAKASNKSSVSSQDTTSSSSSTMPSVTEAQLKQGAESMANADPSSLRAQASQLRSMNPDLIRRSNPAMANFTDQQIKDAATQMEQMADNPDMMKMAAEQMKNMTPQQLEEMKKMMGGGGSMPSGMPSGMPSPSSGAPNMDAASLANMDPKQLKSMMNMMKSNPEMIKSMKNMFPGGASMNEDALMAQINSVADMDESQLQTMLSVASKAQSAYGTVKPYWDKANNLFMVSGNTTLPNEGDFMFSSSVGEDDFDLGYVPPATSATIGANMASATIKSTGEVDDEFDLD